MSSQAGRQDGGYLVIVLPAGQAAAQSAFRYFDTKEEALAHAEQCAAGEERCEVFVILAEAYFYSRAGPQTPEQP